MTVCIRCHRPLKRPTETGMGRVCAKLAAPPVLRHERDLFGYDVDKAILAGQQMVGVRIASSTAEVHMAVRAQFRAARVERGVWSS